MQLTWYGHASFCITSQNGTSIVTDPYSEEISGYRPVTDPADIVIRCSDVDKFHCRADLIPGDPIVIDALTLAQNSGKQTEKGINFYAMGCQEAPFYSADVPDDIGMYRFMVDGLSIGHMGDVGHALTAAQLKFFKGVDILLALAGGNPTIELDDLMQVIDATKPRLVIPMHFRTLRCKLIRIRWLPDFLSYFDDADVGFAFNHTVTISPDHLDNYKVFVLDYM